MKYLCHLWPLPNASPSPLSTPCADFGPFLSPFACSWPQIVAAAVLVLVGFEYYSWDTKTSIALSREKSCLPPGSSGRPSVVLLLFWIMVFSSLSSWPLIYVVPVQSSLLTYECPQTYLWGSVDLVSSLFPDSRGPPWTKTWGQVMWWREKKQESQWFLWCRWASPGCLRTPHKEEEGRLTVETGTAA